jgi:hypothetical protein
MQKNINNRTPGRKGYDIWERIGAGDMIFPFSDTESIQL